MENKKKNVLFSALVLPLSQRERGKQRDLSISLLPNGLVVDKTIVKKENYAGFCHIPPASDLPIPYWITKR